MIANELQKNWFNLILLEYLCEKIYCALCGKKTFALEQWNYQKPLN